MLPPLKNVGGKRWLAPKLSRLVNETKPTKVLEPFAGGLAFSLHFEFEHVIANDTNSPLIGFYKNLINGLRYDHNKFSTCPEFYGSTRERMNYLLKNNLFDTTECSELYYYFNKMAHSGLWRLNSSGEFNVWIGKCYKQVAKAYNFPEFRNVAKQWRFENKSFENLCFKEADLNFVDPPYYKNFVGYSSDGFKWEQQISLLDILEDSEKPTIYCNSFEPQIIHECKKRGFSTYRTYRSGSINSNASKREAVPELIAFRNFGGNRKFASLVKGIENA